MNKDFLNWLDGRKHIITDASRYNKPSPRTWQGLTDEERDELVNRFARYELCHAVENNLKEKNK